MTARELLIAVSINNQGDWQKMQAEFMNRRNQFSDSDVAETIAIGSEPNCTPITILDDDYPKALKDSACAPFVIWTRGNRALLDAERKLAVVGSRSLGAFAPNSIQSLGRKLSEKAVVVVSGSKGSSEHILRGVLSGSGKAIVLLGSGLALRYPSEMIPLYDEVVEKGGLLISELPPYVCASPNAFATSKRILAALGDAMLVTEATAHSGSLIAVAHALNIGKDIYALPVNPLEANHYELVNNELISEGAAIFLSVDRMFETAWPRG